MKKVIFISTNVGIFKEISAELKDFFIFVLADSVEKAINLLMEENGKTFDCYVWDNATVPHSSKLGDILGSDDNEYGLNITRGFNYFSTFTIEDLSRCLKRIIN